MRRPQICCRLALQDRRKTKVRNFNDAVPTDENVFRLDVTMYKRGVPVVQVGNPFRSLSDLEKHGESVNKEIDDVRE